MNQRLFTNSDIRKILKIPQRRIVNVTEKGLVAPVIDASGAGSKRGYSYTNLLEIGLIENLFDIGLGVHLVKKILVDLKKDGDLEAWAENYDAYFSKVTKKYILWVKERQKKHNWFGSVLPVSDGTFKYIKPRDIDLKNLEYVDLVKEWIKPKKPTGVLFYGFKEDGSNKKNIVPWDIENPLAIAFLPEDIYTSKGIIVVNLGKIKEKIDKEIEEMG